MPDELGEALQVEMLAASLRADQPLCKTASDVRNEGERAGARVQSRRVHTSFF
jgi:hypothetical protein